MAIHKVAIGAGHGGKNSTPGKRTPDGEYEWNFNDIVVSAAIDFLSEYDEIEILRLDDASGNTDVSLRSRTNKANAWGADILISDHHNANTGRWGNWTGTETYTYEGNWDDAEKLARIVHRNVLDAYGLRDRGLKKANFHMLRESNMPAILIEGCYMDSLVDIKKLRNKNVLKNAGIAIGEGVLEYFGIEKKASISDVGKPSDKGMYTFLSGNFGSYEKLLEGIGKMRKNGFENWIIHEKLNSTIDPDDFRFLTGHVVGRNVAEFYAKKIKELFGWTVYIEEVK